MSYYGILPLGIPNQPTMNHYGCLAQLSLPKPVGTPCIGMTNVIANIHMTELCKILLRNMTKTTPIIDKPVKGSSTKAYLTDM